jgi:hypothetical protein
MLRKTHSLLGQLIQVRGSNIRVSVYPQIPKAKIVSHDDDNVRLVALHRFSSYREQMPLRGESFQIPALRCLFANF